MFGKADCVSDDDLGKSDDGGYFHDALRKLLERTSHKPRSILYTHDATAPECNVSTAFLDLLGEHTPVLELLLTASPGDGFKESMHSHYRQLLHFGREDPQRRLKVGRVFYTPSCSRHYSDAYLLECTTRTADTLR